jgi:hypothetical protein
MGERMGYIRESTKGRGSAPESMESDKARTYASPPANLKSNG